LIISFYDAITIGEGGDRVVKVRWAKGKRRELEGGELKVGTKSRN
jgi:hypothetical protein